ncbi:MAG: O-antigen ligase family protein [Saprospiraceae bacterium]|nr:O-antigen ligase family protein [Saprospiraceae bacterium]
MSIHPTVRYFIVILFMIVVVLPFTLEISIGSNKITLPSEPLLALGSFILLYIWIRSFPVLWAVAYKPLAWACIGMMVWLTIASIMSVQPWVSYKATLVESIHWWIYYVGILTLAISRDRYVLASLLSSLSISIGFLLVYVWIHHGMHGFQPNTAQIAGQPFFKDHTLYGACFALLVPWNVWLATYWGGKKEALARFHWMLSVALILGVFLSFSRVAWIGIGSASILVFITYRPNRWKSMVVVGGSIMVMILILTLPSRSSQRGEGILPFIAGISSWQYDVSVLERINRYKSAIRMFQASPVTGFGPGTFQFEYHPFQKSDEMTRISSTKPVHDMPGRGGSTHSEYLKALSETGLPGLLTWIMVFIFGLRRAYAKINSREEQLIGLASLSSLLIYLVIGVFNNFVHDGIMALFFWLPLALLSFQPSTLFSQNQHPGEIEPTVHLKSE